MRVDRRGAQVLAALALLYTAQGIPFGLAAEYLPVVLREMGYSRTFIASVFWLQLPWQLKVLWAPLGDHPRVRPYARHILLALQCGLALATASYALFPIATGLRWWFGITFVSALFAATQDIFVDAFAVRSLDAQGRGYGNTAQVAGYRVGIVLGGVALLHYQTRWGTAPTLLACAGLILLAGLGAFALRHDPPAPALADPTSAARPRPTGAVLLHQLRAVVARDVWRVAALAVTYKLGAHTAAALIKPMLVDHGWTREAIKDAVVLYGTGASIVGAALGGLLHRWVRETRALGLAAVVQAASMVPLAAAAMRGAPPGVTVAAIVAEHLASGLGTTVLFAALMSATHRDRAALHYTVLTSLNAVAIAVGGYAGSITADAAGLPAAVGLAMVLCVAPCALLPRWAAHASRSAGLDEAEVEESLTVRGGSL
ncbi:MAG: hypothetical protein Q8S73_10060 [Deltaproteobacteria bacterium]|nr:hypothetical protein [Myxococcales bacterium]MDP3214437.1 hypothetical protein [Deltaproteobacteria bacterium]